MTCCLNLPWQQCPCHVPFRSIPAPESVPRGSWLLDDHVLQRHPLPLHLLTHLQHFPADGWKHGVSHFNLFLSAFFPILCFPFVSASLYAPLWLAWLIETSRLNWNSIAVWLISPHFKSQVGADNRRVVNPERSPPAPTLILPWSRLILWHLSG